MKVKTHVITDPIMSPEPFAYSRLLVIDVRLMEVAKTVEGIKELLVWATDPHQAHVHFNPLYDYREVYQLLDKTLTEAAKELELG